MDARRVLWAAAVLLAGCGEQAQPQDVVSVASLVADPARLRALRAACKADHAGVGDATCNAAAEATRQRFMRGRDVSEPQGTAPTREAPTPAAGCGAP